MPRFDAGLIVSELPIRTASVYQPPGPIPTTRRISARIVGHRAGDVAGHRREGEAGFGECGDIVLGPVPDLNLVAERIDALDALGALDGRKKSLFGDTHAYGEEGVRFTPGRSRSCSAGPGASARGRSL